MRISVFGLGHVGAVTAGGLARSATPSSASVLAHRSAALGLDLPLTRSILAANQRQIARAVERVLATGRRRVSLLGVAFKAETGDPGG